MVNAKFETVMRKWIPFISLACMSVLCAFATGIAVLWSYLAMTGLDLLVTAKKSALQVLIVFAVITAVFWIVSLVALFVTKPYKKN